jgi:hypothetical protein
MQEAPSSPPFAAAAAIAAAMVLPHDVCLCLRKRVERRPRRLAWARRGDAGHSQSRTWLAGRELLDPDSQPEDGPVGGGDEKCPQSSWIDVWTVCVSVGVAWRTEALDIDRYV